MKVLLGILLGQIMFGMFLILRTLLPHDFMDYFAPLLLLMAPLVLASMLFEIGRIKHQAIYQYLGIFLLLTTFLKR